MTTVITSPTPDNLPELARKLRMLAAMAQGGGTVSAALSPDLARALAHLIDGGGFAGAAEKVIAEKVDAAFDELMESTGKIRRGWVDRCQGLLAEAQAANRTARRDLWITAGLALGVSVLLILGGVL